MYELIELTDCELDAVAGGNLQHQHQREFSAVTATLSATISNSAPLRNEQRRNSVTVTERKENPRRRQLRSPTQKGH